MPTGCVRKDRIRVSLGAVQMGIIILVYKVSYLVQERILVKV